MVGDKIHGPMACEPIELRTASNQNAAATACVSSGKDVSERVPDHPGGREIDLEFRSSSNQHAGRRLAIRVVRTLFVVAARSMATPVDRVDHRAELRQLRLHSPVDHPEPVLVEQPPADDRLIRDDDREQACGS